MMAIPKKLKLFFGVFMFFVLFGQSAQAQDELTWQDCVAEAAKNNPDLVSAAEGITIQKANRGITVSDLLPQITADAAGSTAKTSTTTSGSTTSATSDTFSYGVTGSQLIFDGLKTIHDVRASSENIKAIQQAYRFASSQVRLDLRTAFVNVLKAQELIRVAEEIVKIRKDSLVLITMQYESGLEHRGALLTAEANMAQANFELAQAKRALVFAQRQLTKALGRREFTPLSVQGDFVVHDTALEKPDFEALVKNNPSVLEAIFKKNAAQYGVKSAFSDFAPTLSATARTGRSSSHWPPENEGWNMGLSVSLPLFEGGLRVAEVSKARAEFRQAIADEQSVHDAAIVYLEQTWVALQDALQTVDVQEKSLAAAQERAKIAEAQYSTGFISFDNWIIIQNNLVAAKKSYLQSQANALLTEANWIQAKGETLDYV
ncbi:MAG: TolC family protein [Candidatus Omnitrophota bacterium]